LEDMAGAIGFSSFYGNSGHIMWSIVSWDTIVKANTVRDDSESGRFELQLAQLFQRRFCN